MKTLKRLYQMHQEGEKIAALVVFDATFASISARAGIDCLIICDHVGQMVAGYQSALPVTMEQIMYHAEAVSRGAPNTWRIIDMPFLSYDEPTEAVQNASKLLEKGNAHMVKIKMLGTAQVEIIQALKEAHIPVCVQLSSSSKIFDKSNLNLKESELEKKRLRLEALAFENAGADLLILDSVSSSIANEIMQNANIPILGKGSGSHVSGQILTAYEVIGIGHPSEPNHAHNFLADTGNVEGAIKAYQQAVKQQTFPKSHHSY
ncbi:MAG: 3-methyl-2-oxobutanoate hydroxymethyltransferase [Cardiobacteriaceae bacterium]|nr:3-methyl-2-oxobutanoate hydroxymethyltransferase [Cardiobacteriaceae bacterium]